MQALRLACACAALLGCSSVVDHFKYPTGKSDWEDYTNKMARVRPGMPAEAFTELWAEDEEGHRVLGSEPVVFEREAGVAYVLGYHIRYMEAAGRDVDAERRLADSSRDGHDFERWLFENRETMGFWKSYHVTAVVTCVGGEVVRVEQRDDVIQDR